MSVIIYTPQTATRLLAKEPVVHAQLLPELLRNVPKSRSLRSAVWGGGGGVQLK